VPPSSTPQTLVDLEVDLVVRSIPHSHVPLEQPFKITFELTLSALLPAPGKTRLVYIMIQHLQPLRVSPVPPARTLSSPLNHTSPRHSLDKWSPKSLASRTAQRDAETLESASPTMSPKRGVFNFGLGLAQTYADSPLSNHSGELAEPVASLPDAERRPHSTITPIRQSLFRLPPPDSASIKSQSVMPLGGSVLSLPSFQLTRPHTDTSIPEVSDDHPRTEAIREFECTFVPIRKGLANVGGLRVLLIEDREVEERSGQDNLILIPHIAAEAKVLREWDVMGEIWITS
jgi:trafficking protein particle complex subunit 13